MSDLLGSHEGMGQTLQLITRLRIKFEAHPSHCHAATSLHPIILTYHQPL